MRRPIVAALAVSLVWGAVVAPASAKKPKRKPVRFEASGSLALGHPGDVAGEANATRAAFLDGCSIPPTQGTDGYVVELPPNVTANAANVTLTGADATGFHDLDMHFYDEACAPNGALASDLSDEFGLMPEGTRYVLITAFTGVEITFTFESLGV